MEEIRLSLAEEQDARALLAIYAPYVTATAITYEYDVPTEEDFCGRIRHTLETYPYLVARAGDQVVGYAYLGPFKERASYQWAAETSVYLRMDQRGRGIGRRLYLALEDIARAQNILNLNACIAQPEREDEYVTWASRCFHEKMGYALVGEFHRCASKFGRWYNMIWMEKELGPHPARPEKMIPFPEIEQKARELLKDMR